jgi:hypothetical protein
MHEAFEVAAVAERLPLKVLGEVTSIAAYGMMSSISSSWNRRAADKRCFESGIEWRLGMHDWKFDKMQATTFLSALRKVSCLFTP